MQRSSCGILIKQIHDELERQSNNALKSSDLTLSQIGALLALRDEPDKKMPLKKLEKKLSLAQSTTVGIVARLKKKGFVETLDDPEDGRVKIVSITQSGKDICAKADQSMTNAEQKLLYGLTDTEQNIFITLLKKVNDSLMHSKYKKA